MKVNRKTYIEMPFRQFVESYPSYAPLLKEYLPDYEEFLTNPLYVIRVSSDGKVEVGYPEDPWYIH